MVVVCINGMPRSGKDTFCDLCKEIIPSVENISSVDFVKDVAKFCGWNGEKTPHNRKFLSDLKDLLIEWNNVPYKDITNKIYNFRNNHIEQYGNDNNLIVFVHIREPKEIDKLVHALKAKTLLIKRLEVESNVQSNHSDMEVLNYDYDYVITNNGTKEELKNKAAVFLREILS